MSSAEPPCACGEGYRRLRHEERVGFLTDPKWIGPGKVNHNASGLYRHLHHHRKPFHGYVRTRAVGLAKAFGADEKTVRRWVAALEEWGLVRAHRIHRGLCVHFTNAGDFKGDSWIGPRVIECPDRFDRLERKQSVNVVQPNRSKLSGQVGLTPISATTSSATRLDSSTENHHREDHRPIRSQRQDRLAPIVLEFPRLSSKAKRQALSATHHWANGKGSWAGLGAIESAFRIVLEAFEAWEAGRLAIEKPYAYASRLLHHYCEQFNVNQAVREHEQVAARPIVPRMSFEQHLRAAMDEGYEYEEACAEAARRSAHHDLLRTMTARIG